jgi:hypothetical protein
VDEALAELRQRATREGYCYQHVQAITVVIDQHAEKALGNRDYFLNKPYGIGGPGREGDVALSASDCPSHRGGQGGYNENRRSASLQM